MHNASKPAPAGDAAKGKSMVRDQIAELKRIAEAASPGPWRGDRIDGSVKYDLLDADGDPVIRGDNGNVADTGCYGIQSDEDEAYLLAFDPPTCLALIARIEALEGERDLARADLERHRRPKCSCMEVYGENPNCIQHGHGTEWAKANPDICAWVDECRDKDARIEALEAGLKPFAEAAGHLHPAHPENGLTLDGIEVRHWRRAANLLGDRRPCTCHPDDNPPRPCPQKYALSECRAAGRAALNPESKP